MKLKYILIAVISCISAAVWANGIEEMQGLELKHVKIPYYNGTKLQLLIFSESGEKRGTMMFSRNTFLDLLLDNVNVDKIPDGWNADLYEQGSALIKVLQFWKPRFKISDAVIFTNNCFIDQKEAEAFGDQPVFLRTPIFDLDGNGFRANFKKQIIEINSDIRITVRSSEADPRKLLTGAPLPTNHRIITATADSLRLDRKNNELMLIGQVKVIDGRNTMTCDRLTVYLTPADNSPSRQVSVPSAADEKAVLDGVSRILADGNVQLIQRPADPDKLATELQTSRSDHLEYDTKRGIIILTGDDNDPVLTRGTDTKLSGKRIELLRHEDKMFIMQDCRIQSLVRDDRGMLVHIRQISSDRANFDGKNNVANFHGNVTAVDQMTTLKTDSLRVHLTVDQKTSSHKIELLFGNGNVQIVSVSEKKDPKNPEKRITEKSVITSRQAELNFLKNKLVFYNDVKIRDAMASLDCNRLDLFLADRKDKSEIKKISRAPFAAGMEGKDKTVTKIVALGNVLMIAENDELRTDMLTLFFRDLPRGMKPSPGMLQSGGVQLIKILCDGAVQATSVSIKNGKKENRILKAANAKSDLLANYSEFHGNVSIMDDITEIYCRDMYIFTGVSPVNEVIVENGKLPAAPKISEEDALDADPFAMDMGENSVPKRIAISDTQDLKRVVCKRNVVLLRRDKNGKLQRAGGDQAVYTVDTREVVLTAERPRRPWLRSEGRKQFCDIIRSDMATEDLRGIGNVEVMPDDE